MPDPARLLLIRHGEVFNPNHLVYGDLRGFHLSPLGVLQAHATGRHLSDSRIDVVLTSPLSRAVETATAVARHHGLAPVIDQRLTESGQFPHWTGNTWEELSELFPGEVNGYLADASVAGGRESLTFIADRYVSVAEEAFTAGSNTIVIVGHQDPVQAARLTLTGRMLSDLRTDPPSHAEVVTLARTENARPDGALWTEVSRWNPAVSTG